MYNLNQISRKLKWIIHICFIGAYCDDLCIFWHDCLVKLYFYDLRIFRIQIHDSLFFFSMNEGCTFPDVLYKFIGISWFFFLTNKPLIVISSDFFSLSIAQMFIQFSINQRDQIVIGSCLSTQVMVKRLSNQVPTVAATCIPSNYHYYTADDIVEIIVLMWFIMPSYGCRIIYSCNDSSGRDTYPVLHSNKYFFYYFHWIKWTECSQNYIN